MVLHCHRFDNGVEPPFCNGFGWFIDLCMRTNIAAFPSPPFYGWLRAVPLAVATFLAVPVLAGIGATVLPAFGIFPGLKNVAPLEPWTGLLSYPSIGKALWISLSTGFGAALLSVVTALGLITALYDTPFYRRLQQALAPILAMPHAAVAIAALFLLSPAGWIARLVSPGLSGWDRPPDIGLIGDPFGLSMVGILAVKEIAFLLFVGIAALDQFDAAARLRVARALGYRRITGFLKVVLPTLYRRLRLPIYAVLSYSLSVVDVGLIAGPQTPPTFAILLFRWFNDPDLALRFRACAGALVLIAVIAVAVLSWHFGARLLGSAARGVLSDGRRSMPLWEAVVPTLVGIWAMMAVLVALGLITIVLWSLAGPWRFPQALPPQLGLNNYAWHAGGMGDAIVATLWTGLLAGLGAVAASLLCLEAERRRGRPSVLLPPWLFYVPLVAPQLGFLFGVQILLIALRADATLGAVVAIHGLFVLPYVWLLLAPAWRSHDVRYDRVARTLGATPWSLFWRVRLPMLAGPCAVALAVGFAVSVAQYTPTLFAGGGRIATVTTEAVTLASGASRRGAAVFAVAQMLLPWLGFALATGLARRRRVRPGR